jgi:precorrin-4/cobalt-precorrin-4 C11-methyltransferase
LPGKVYFVGAGPGDPELLTLKGKRLLESADVVIYADSLVDPRVCEFAREGAEVYGSSTMHLEEIVGLMVAAVGEGKSVVRLHTGDPSIFGAIAEQTALLEEKGIRYETVPGVSSLFAAAAALNVELTLPEVSQTVIITRREGRTPVPEGQSIKELSKHSATIALFLSAGMLEEVVQELISGGYPENTPVAVVYRASWPDQQILRGTLADIAGLAAGIKKQALILVGEALNPIRATGLNSKLYNRTFGHGRRASSG